VKGLVALGILVAGAVAAFAVYTFGREDDETRTHGRRIFTVRQGDVIRVPATATRCVASSEGGFPNLFCSRTRRGRYEVVFFEDEVQLYDLARHGEPMAATFVVPAEMTPRRK
jgi:hypothetical protein